MCLWQRNGLWKDAVDAEHDLDNAEIKEFSRRTTPAHSPVSKEPVSKMLLLHLKSPTAVMGNLFNMSAYGR